MQFFAYSSDLGLFPLNVAVASIFVGFTAIIVGMTMRRSALPLRHGLLCAAVMLTLASPLLVWIASSRGLGIIPISLGSPLDPDSLTASAKTIGEVSSPIHSHGLLESSGGDATSSESSGRSAVERENQMPELAFVPAPANSAKAISHVSLSQLLTTSSVEAVRQIGFLLTLVWVAVALWFVVRLVRGLFAIRQLRSSLTPTTDPRLIQAAIRALSATTPHGYTPVYESPIAPAPLTLGCWRPVIVMPTGLAATLDDEQLVYVLAHEGAHVVRHDTAIALLQQLAGIGFWWNPLLRAVNRQIDELREQICDDHVVKQLGDGLPLAEAIVKVVEWSATRYVRLPLVTTLLDDVDSIEQRITRLAERDRSLSVRLSAWSAALVGLFGVMLAAVSLVPAVRAKAEASTAIAATPQIQWQAKQAAKPVKPTTLIQVQGRARSEATQKSGAGQASEQRAKGDTPANFKTKVVRGHVVDQAGKPVGNARLWLPLRYRPRRVVQATTDDSGRFEFKFPADWVSPQVTGSSWTIWAYAPGYSIATESPFDVVRGTSEKDVTVKLAPQAKTRFKILTPAGAPLAGVLVRPQNYKTTVGYDGVPEEMFPAVSASTDAEGVATLPAIQAGPLFRIQLEHERFGKQAIRVDRDKAEAVRDIVLREPGRIEGKLTGERPEWLRAVKLTFTTDNQDEWTATQGEAQVVTDDDGHFSVPVIASGGPLRTYFLDLDRSLPVRPLLDDNLYVTGGKTMTIEIPFVSAPKVVGKVKVKSNGNPVPNAEISLGYGGFRQSESVVTDENGQFEGRVLPGPVRVHIISMPTGHMQLGRPWAEPFQVPKGVEDFELPTIEVVGTHKVSGQLTDERGQPLAAMQVMVVDGGRRYGGTKTDSDGRFTMNVPDGVETRIEVYVEGRGQEPTTIVRQDPLVLRYAADAQEQATEIERRSKADVTLTGRVLSGGKPLAGVKVTLNRGVPTAIRMDRDGKPQNAQQTGMRIVKVTSAETDSQGSYRLVGLKAGDSYQIEVKPPFLGADPAWHHQLPSMPKLPENAQGDVALPDVNLLKLTQSVTGKVVDPDGNPVAGATVSAMLRNGSSIPRSSSGGPPPWTDTDREGRFTLQQLPDVPLAIMAYIRKKEGGRIRFPAKVNVDLNQQDIRIVLDPSLTEKDE